MALTFGVPAAFICGAEVLIYSCPALPTNCRRLPKSGSGLRRIGVFGQADKHVAGAAAISGAGKADGIKAADIAIVKVYVVNDEQRFIMVWPMDVIRHI